VALAARGIVDLENSGHCAVAFLCFDSHSRHESIVIGSRAALPQELHGGIKLATPYYPMRLGVFLPNWVGDVVMATPALRAMRQFVGDKGQLVGIMRPYVAEVLTGTSLLDQQITYDKPTRRLAVATREVYQSIRAAKLDRVVLLTNSLRTAWMAWRCGAPERFGYRGQGMARSWLLTNCLAPPLAPEGGPMATIDAYRRLSEAAGCGSTSPQLELATTNSDEAAADAVWQRLRLPPGDRVIVLNSGSAYGAAKQWPAEYFTELARRIVDGGDYSVLVNCGPSEREVARGIAASANDPRIVSLADEQELPMGLTKACLRRSRLLVTTDSGPRFFAIAFGRQVITLFGPTDPLRTITHYDAEACVSLSLDCQPCMERTCPLLHHRCMHDLSVDQVYDIVLKKLDAKAAASAAAVVG
jgi:heptosyltransferase-2